MSTRACARAHTPTHTPSPSLHTFFITAYTQSPCLLHTHAHTFSITHTFPLSILTHTHPHTPSPSLHTHSPCLSSDTHTSITAHTHTHLHHCTHTLPVLVTHIPSPSHTHTHLFSITAHTHSPCLSSDTHTFSITAHTHTLPFSINAMPSGSCLLRLADADKGPPSHCGHKLSLPGVRAVALPPVLVSQAHKQAAQP